MFKKCFKIAWSIDNWISSGPFDPDLELISFFQSSDVPWILNDLKGDSHSQPPGYDHVGDKARGFFIYDLFGDNHT